MMELIPEKQVVACLGPIRNEMVRHAPVPPLEMLEGKPGQALLAAMLFEWMPEMVGLRSRSVEALYNRYYWFVKFATLWQRIHGPDAGVEQQAAQILEQFQGNIDWAVLQQVDSAARAEPAYLRSPSK